MKQNLRCNTTHPSWRERRHCWHAECGPQGSLYKSAFRSLARAPAAAFLSRTSNISSPFRHQAGLSKSSNSIVYLRHESSLSHSALIYPVSVTYIYHAYTKPPARPRRSAPTCTTINARNWCSIGVMPSSPRRTAAWGPSTGKRLHCNALIPRNGCGLCRRTTYRSCRQNIPRLFLDVISFWRSGRVWTGSRTVTDACLKVKSRSVCY